MESPFTSVLHTNYAPTEQELGIIFHLLVGPENELQYLDGAIRNLEVRLRQMSERREVVRDMIKAHRALTGWIRRVPDDVLQEIFFNTLPYSYLPSMSSKSSPVVLTHVCRRWRQLALSNTHLWVGMHVKKGEDRGNILAWLSRAGSLPISLSFESPYDIGYALESLPNPQTKWIGFQMLLERYGTEQRHFTPLDSYLKFPLFPPCLEDIGNSPIQRSSRLYLDISQNLPRSRSISTDPTEDHRKRIVKILTKFSLQKNSRLRSLTLHHNHTSTRLDIVPFIPCANLEYLELGLDDYAIPSAIAILQQCPRLVSFKIPLGAFDTSQAELSSQLSALRTAHDVHPSVEQFSFAASFTARALQSISTAFHRDAFPSLTFMALEFNHTFSRHLDGIDLPKVLAALDTSLTALTISPKYLKEAELIQFLAGLPSLVQLYLLELDAVNVNSLYGIDIILFLSPRAPEETDKVAHGCQRLQYLKLGRNSSTFDDQGLPRLLFGREVPLRQAHIHFRWDYGEMDSGAELEDFAELIDAGLDLRLRYGQPYDKSPPRKPRVFPQVDRLVYGWEDF